MKDTDYTFGTSDDPFGGQDNRLHYRLTARARVSLELEASYPEPRGMPCAYGRELVCGVRDLSADGLRLTCDCFTGQRKRTLQTDGGSDLVSSGWGRLSGGGTNY